MVIVVVVVVVVVVVGGNGVGGLLGWLCDLLDSFLSMMFVVQLCCVMFSTHGSSGPPSVLVMLSPLVVASAGPKYLGKQVLYVLRCEEIPAQSVGDPGQTEHLWNQWMQSQSLLVADTSAEIEHPDKHNTFMVRSTLLWDTSFKY